MTVGSCFRAVRVAIPDIEEPASCGVNNGKGEVVPGGPTKCQSRTKLHQWKLEGSRCPGLSRWLDDNSPAPAFDQIAPRTNPKLVLLDKEERGWSRFRRSWERRLTESRSGSGTRRGSRPLRRRCASAHGTVGRSESAAEGSSDDPCSRRSPPPLWSRTVPQLHARRWLPRLLAFTTKAPIVRGSRSGLSADPPCPDRDVSGHRGTGWSSHPYAGWRQTPNRGPVHVEAGSAADVGVFPRASRR